MNFIEFYLKRLLENVNSGDKLPLYYTDRFKHILVSIESEITRKLLSMENDSDRQFLKTYIDIDENSTDKISFIVVNKIKEVIVDKNHKNYKKDYLGYDQINSIYSARQRSTMKINRFINEIFNNEYISVNLSLEEKEKNRQSGIKTKPQILEEFVNKFKSIRKPGEFELVKDDQIVYWYDSANYSEKSGTIMSCMSNSRCSDYLQFYAKNPEKVSLLILKENLEDDTILGRALVWNLDEPSGRTYMDRIYTIHDYQVEHFIDYAKKHKWLYKSSQNMYAETPIVDTVNNERDYIQLVIEDMKDTNEYPYMDTLKYYNRDTLTLTNNEDYDDDQITLEDQYGGYSGGQNNQSIEELQERFTDEIVGDFKYFAQNYFPNLVWDHMDDDSFKQSYIDSEVEYYDDDFENAVSTDFIKKYIRKEESSEKVSNAIIKLFPKDEDDEDDKTLDDLEDSEIYELVEELDIQNDICVSYSEDRFESMSAKDIVIEFYGKKEVDNLSDEIYRLIEDYIDERECAEDYAENEDEDYLRERYSD